VVTEADGLIQYMLSTWHGPEDARLRLTDSVERLINRDGAIHITKDAGIFVARKR
jgi:hypothetical protein